MSALGKTILRIEERPTSPEYSYARDDTVLIHFTDGTALEVSGSSYEEVSLDWELRDADEVRAWQRAAQGRREQERLQRLKAQEWRSLTCGQRAERNAERDAKRGQFALLTDEMGKRMLMDMIVSSNRFGYGFEMTDPHTTVKGHCKRCGERFCENAPDIPVYGDRHLPAGSIWCQSGTMTIPIKKKTKARKG